MWQVIQHLENSRMWYCINRVTDGPTSGGVLRVERHVNGQLKTNTEQENMVSCIKEETDYRFILARSAKITNTLLAKNIGYLSGAQVAEALIAGEMEIPNNVDNVTTLILDKISWLGMKLIGGNCDKIMVLPEHFKRY